MEKGLHYKIESKTKSYQHLVIAPIILITHPHKHSLTLLPNPYTHLQPHLAPPLDILLL